MRTSVTRGLVLIFKIYDNFLYIILFICIFHSTRMNLRAMILRCNWDMAILINSNKLEQLQIEVANTYHHKLKMKLK
jgi:hypothetical protein